MLPNTDFNDVLNLRDFPSRILLFSIIYSVFSSDLLIIRRWRISMSFTICVRLRIYSIVFWSVINGIKNNSLCSTNRKSFFLIRMNFRSLFVSDFSVSSIVLL